MYQKPLTEEEQTNQNEQEGECGTIYYIIYIWNISQHQNNKLIKPKKTKII